MDAAVNSEQVVQQRQRRLAILARADRGFLEHAWQALGTTPAFRQLKQAETGLAMIRARAGGNGNQFNLGEMTVTRCVIALEPDGLMGVGYVAGRDRRKAELVALFDALAQRDGFEDTIERSVIRPLEQAHAEARQRRQAKVAATKVDFFTMVRGES